MTNSTQTPGSAKTSAAQIADNPILVEDVLAAVAADVGDGYQCVTAAYIAQRYYPQIELGLPLLITRVDEPTLAGQIKRALVNAYPPDHPVTWVWGQHGSDLQLATTPLHELDRRTNFERATVLYVPPLPPYHSFSALQEIVAHLRAPEGCPWDRQQTLATMCHDLLSECAEVLEAIDAEADGGDNSHHIAEELGDLLGNAVLITQIASDTNRFQMADAVHSIVTKLIRRHPHVFGDTAVDGVQSVLVNWDAIKAQEKADKGLTPGHPLDGVPAALPALEKARQLQSKAAKAGLLDRDALAQASAALAALFDPPLDEQQLGELLWRLVALAQKAGLNAEDALRSYAVQFRSNATK